MRQPPFDERGIGMKKTPLYYAQAACDSVMRRFTPKELPPVYKLSYHHGVFYSGMLRTAVRAGRWEYFEYVKTRLDLQIDKDGNIINEENIPELDDVQPGIILLAMYQKTQDVRYKKIVDGFIRELKEWKVNAAGGFWHKEYFPNQMWLDGLYMTGPLLCEYAQTADDAACYDLAAKQFEIMWDHTYDEASGLLLHGWDASREAEWADKETGCAPEFWGRSVGWVGVALCDVLDALPKKHAKRTQLEGYLQKLMAAVLKYQDVTGLWYQVLDKGNRSDNWTETSCSCLFVYSLLKGIRKGYLPEEYTDAAMKGYRAVLSQTEETEGGFQIKNVCVGTGIGSYEYYISRPTQSGDLHGVGAFTLMCAEVYDFLHGKQRETAL